MVDIKKVINGLQCIIDGSVRCENCGYAEDKHGSLSCQQKCAKEAIALLKVNPVAELVRCKDCKHYKINTVYPGTSMIMKYCAKTGIAEIKPDWFCADGEHKIAEALRIAIEKL